jgi:asparagine synthase (glutamine-hydrolysing)
MCGIYAHFYHDGFGYKDYDHVNYIKPRGPDKHSTLITNSYRLDFFRLAIVGIENGNQPFKFNDIHMMCNGEIYNYKHLTKTYNVHNKTDSDCEIIAHLYRKYGIEQLLSMIDGEFSFILIDKRRKLVHFARDPIGVKPMYCSIVYDDDNKIYSLELASVEKGIREYDDIFHVQPGYIHTFDMTHRTLSIQKYNTYKYVPRKNITISSIYDALQRAVVKRIEQTDKPLGFFLSGGLDSCIVLSIALRCFKFKTRPKVFTFGFYEEAPDVVNAKKMINWINMRYGANCVDWHLVIRPLEEGFKEIDNTIFALGSYDTTTVRASVPMYMLSKYIAENTDVKVLLSGEGSDELFGGYLYFKYAPNDTAFRNEIMFLLENLHYYDVLRADRSTAACGLEVRPPFLDHQLIKTVLCYGGLKTNTVTTKPILRVIAERYNLLPSSILYGRKEAFSDAVGLSWQDYIEDNAREIIENMDSAPNLSHHVPSDTYTAKYIQMLYSKYLSNLWQLTPRLWLPNQNWVNTGNEPSARALDNYTNPENNNDDNDNEVKKYIKKLNIKLLVL